MGSTAFTDDSCPGLRDRGFDPLCWTSRARVRGLKVSTSSPGLLKSGSRARGVTSWPGRLMPGSEVPRARPAVTGDLGPGPRVCVVDQLSQETRDSERGPGVATSFPGRLGPRSNAPGVEHLSRATRVRVRGPAVSTSCPGRIGPVPVGPQYRPTVPGDSRPCPRAHGINESSRVTWARYRDSAGSTSSPG